MTDRRSLTTATLLVLMAVSVSGCALLGAAAGTAVGAGMRVIKEGADLLTEVPNTTRDDAGAGTAVAANLPGEQPG